MSVLPVSVCIRFFEMGVICLVSIYDLIPPLLRGAGVTVQITLMSAILAFVLSFLFGFGRLSKYFVVRLISVVYVEVFRGTSLLVQLFWLYFALPLLGISLNPLIAGIMALGLNYGAYGAEVVRSSILAIPKEQTEATIALNMTWFQRTRLVILPQAFLIMLPTFGNVLIEVVKGTSLVSLVTITDLTYQGVLLNTTTLKTTEIFSLLLVMYFVIAMPLTMGVRWLERRASIGRF
jgi:polar amino acid transport system permease protein